MNQLKIFILSGVVTVMCAHFAWAAGITSISIPTGRTVEVTGPLCEDGSVDSFETTLLDDTLHIHFFVSEGTAGCETETTLGQVEIPACNAYNRVTTFLFVSDTLEVQDAMSTEGTLGVDISGCCQEQFDLCDADYQAACSAETVVCPTSIECDAILNAGGDNLWDRWLECVNCAPSASSSSCDLEYTCDQEFDTCLTSMADPIEDDPVVLEEPEVYAQCDLDKLNIKAKGNYFTCRLESSTGSGVEGIDRNTLELRALGAYMEADFSLLEEDSLVVKFSKKILKNIVRESMIQLPATIDLVVSGEQDGMAFEANETVTVFKRGRKKLCKKKYVKNYKKGRR